VTTKAQAQAVVCPVCNAQAGQPCTQPSNTTRTPVAWVHLARESECERAQHTYSEQRSVVDRRLMLTSTCSCGGYSEPTSPGGWNGWRRHKEQQ